MSYTIQPMTREQVNIAVDWAAAEGWNPGLDDGKNYYLADPNGFLLGCLEGEPAASISVVRYGDSFGFLGFYIVKPEYRGQGYGIQIWNAGLKYLEGRTVGLDGVVDQQDNYRKSGFVLAHRNMRFEGRGGGNTPDNSGIVPLDVSRSEWVVDYDRDFFPEDRDHFIRGWIAQDQGLALGYRAENKLIGYGVIRRCRVGWKIGPLFADSDEIADVLFCALRAHAASGDPVYLDTPETNINAVNLAERYDMKLCFETARMYLGSAPDLPIHRTFGITSFEIG